MKDDRFDLEGELRAGRARPGADFASALAGSVREASGRARQRRTGMRLSLAGLVIVAVASFGGVGYSASSHPAAVKHEATSAATAQYKPFTPKTHKAAVPKAQAKGAEVQKAAPKPSSQLPFTGLALWVPLAIGSLLIVAGVVLRTRGRRRGNSTAS